MRSSGEGGEWNLVSNMLVIKYLIGLSVVTL
jgi:hypothetical protein